LIVGENAKIVLADGAVLKTYGTVSQWPAVLQDAAIHVDAMAYAAQLGTTVNPLRNYGTVGGAFTRTVGGTYAAVQADAFGAGRPGLSLGSGSAYRLTGFTNTVPQITVFTVMKRTAKDQWGGPYSFSSLTATNGDNKAGIRAWYLENSHTNASGEFYSGSYGGNQNAFSGIFGEVIVFFRSLTPTEVSGVQNYLMTKWFGAEEEADRGVLAVTVDADSTAGLALPPVAKLKKDGAGTLAVSSVGSAATNTLTLDEGTLHFAESVIHRKAEIWVDPSDADSLTTNDSGRVTVAQNKGRRGGTWVPNTTGPTLGTTYTPLRTAFEFQGAQALKLQTFRNTDSESNQAMTVFTVLVRSSALGAWSGAFVFAPSLALLTGAEDQVRQRLLYESADGTWRDYVCGGGGISQLITLTGDPTLPYLVSLEEAPKSFLLSAEWADGYGCETNALYGFTKACENRSLEFAQLGARITTGYASRAFWKGAVGEFLVFNCELTREEKKAVMDYLRIRWLGTGPADPDAVPEVVAGRVPDPVPGASLILAADTKLEQTAATQPVKDLTAGEGVTFERSDVTGTAGFALFNVSGTLSFPTSLSLTLLSLPDDNARLFTYGTKTGTPAWTISGNGTRTCTVVDLASDSAVWLIRDNGTLLLMR